MTKIAVLAALCACTMAVSRTAVPAHLDPLMGVWEIRLEPFPPSRTEARPEPTTVTVALLRGRPPRDVIWMNLESPSHYGVYSGDLKHLGVVPPDSAALPAVGGRVLLGDSVQVVLNPAPDHGALVLTGLVHEGLIRGTWVVTSYGVGNTGRFSMSRLE